MRILVFLTLFLFTANTYALGPEGHRIVGHIASQRLSDKANKRIKKILGDLNIYDKSIANWPDKIRRDMSWRRPYPSNNLWHYINIPYETEEQTLIDFTKKNTITWTTNEFTQRILSKKLTPQQEIEAISFLVHLLGKVHSKLHRWKHT